MRNLFIQFRKSEDGASLVEYAVALIVVTLVGGAGVVAIGQDAGRLAEVACDRVDFASTAGVTAAGAVGAAAPTIADGAC